MYLLNVRPSASFRDCDAARKPKQLPTPGVEHDKKLCLWACRHFPVFSYADAVVCILMKKEISLNSNP